MDDFSKLDKSIHMFKWLDQEPYQHMRTEAQRVFGEQVEGAKILSFQATSEPQWLSGGKPVENDGKEGMVLVRAAVAFACELKISSPSGEVHLVRGIYTWAAVKLDDPANSQQKIWFDINGTLEDFGSQGELMARVHFA